MKTDLDTASELGRSAVQRLRDIEVFKRRLRIYDSDWRQESGRQQEIGNLNNKLKTFEKLLTEHARLAAKLGQSISEADDRLRIITYKLDELKKYEDILFPSAWSRAQSEHTGETGGWDDYIAAAGVLKAKIDAMSRDVAGLEELNRHIKEYQMDIRDLETDIQRTGQEFEDVAASYRPVTEQEISKYREEATSQNKVLNQAEGEHRETAGKVQIQEGNWQDKCNQIMSDHGRSPADLAEADLNQRRRELTENDKNILAALATLTEQISNTDRLLGTYRGVVAELKDEGMEEDATPVWDPDLESEILYNNPEAPRQAVRKSGRELKQAQDSLVSTLAEWLRTIDATQGDLDTLNNLDVNNIFRQLRARTAMPNWEEESELVADGLTHVERVVENVRTELERRMADMDRIMDEIVDRSYRQATNVLDELQLFQGMSAVELRGTRLPLIRIDLRRPDAAEGKERMWRYLQKVIEDAVQRRQSGESDDVLQQFLAASVRSPALIEQLTPLDEIRFDVLKPRSGGSVYQSSDYDRWHDLVEWSVGQRYIGRFTVFVVLMAYLRQRRSTGQKTSVVIADNPFGEAWYVRARNTGTFRVPVAYDPRLMDIIYLRLDAGRQIEPCNLTGRCQRLLGYTWWEYEEWKKVKAEKAVTRESRDRQADAEFHAEAGNVVERAQAEARKTPTNQSKQARVRGIRTNRQAEKEETRAAGAWRLGKTEHPKTPSQDIGAEDYVPPPDDRDRPSTA